MTVQEVYIKKLDLNLKGPMRSYDLGQYTVLLGDPESGKSAIAQGLQMLADGCMADALMRKSPLRDKKRLELVAAGETMEIRGELNAGPLSLEVVGASAVRPPHMDLPIPVQQLRDAFSGSPLTAAKFLVPFLVPHVDLSEEWCDALWAKLSAQHKLLPERPEWLHADQLSGQRALDIVNEMFSEAKKASDLNKPLLITLATLQKFRAPFGLSAVRKPYFLSMSKRRLVALKSKSGDADMADWFGTEVKLLGGKEAIANIPDLDEVENHVVASSLCEFAEAMERDSINIAAASKFYKALADALWAVLDDALVVALPAYFEKVEKYLLDGEKFRLDPALWVPSLYRPARDEWHSALSGCTEARVLGAMGCALAMRGRLSIVILDDRQWSGQLLADQMRAYDGAPCQIIIMTTVPPKGRMRASWTVLDLNEQA